MNQKKGLNIHLTSGIIILVLTLIGFGLFLGSFTTNYYVFGAMNSGLILGMIIGAIVLTIASSILQSKYPDNFWIRYLSFGVIACLAFAAMLLIGDRVEGIGNCILTDYDSGHGGEEAIYMSLAASLQFLIAMVYSVIGTFRKDPSVVPGKGKTMIMAGIAAAFVIASSVGVIELTGLFAKGNMSGGDGKAGTYSITFNQNNNNIEDMPSYQFSCSDFSGFLKADSRMFIDEKLTLDGKGNYTLFSDAYTMEAGKRCEIGDDTGLGMNLQLTAEGTYTVNPDGTVTTNRPTHATFLMETDTYSSQMKGAAQMNVEGNDADGTYDSADYPSVLDFAPATTWTLADGAILKYAKAGLSGDFVVSYTQNNGNVEDMPDYQFSCSDFSGLCKYDSRLFADVKLTLDGAGSYTLFSDIYTMEAGKRCEIGDDTGLGLILQLTAEGTYMDNGDGTVTTAKPTHATFVMGTDTYSSQMKGAVNMNVDGHDEDGTYDSDSYPAVLDFAPETVFTLENGKIVSYRLAEEGEGGETPEPAGEVTGVTIKSDDEGTEMTFGEDGRYRFWFAAYSIEDIGTYTYENGVLTLTDKNGKTTTAEGDPLKLHYAYSDSDQLTGDFTIPASTFAKGGEAPAGVTIKSDDEGTEMTFNPDGTYRFWFAAYSIEDIGTYKFENGVLTLTDKNGKETKAEGDPLKLHYAYSDSDQLTGDFTIPVNTFDFQGGSDVKHAVIKSDDEGTQMTFYANGEYTFFFEAYNITDEGTYTYENGVLTLTDKNGKQSKAEGDPLKLHYTYSDSDQLTGDFTIPASTFDFADAAGEGVTVKSDDEGTEMTFNPDGSYRFWFESYKIEDIGTWTFKDGVLTLKDKNGKESKAEGNPLKLHYTYSDSDQLTGDFTIDPSVLP